MHSRALRQFYGAFCDGRALRQFCNGCALRQFYFHVFSLFSITKIELMPNFYCSFQSGLTFGCELCCQRKGAQNAFGGKVEVALKL